MTIKFNMPNPHVQGTVELDAGEVGKLLQEALGALVEKMKEPPAHPRRSQP